MVKCIEKYLCEICGLSYYTYEYALKCEEKGKEGLLVNVGDIVTYVDDYYNSEIDLAIVETEEGHESMYTLGYLNADDKDSPISVVTRLQGNHVFKNMCRIKR
ncbi:MAG: hypothetical protein ACI35O_13910 [Bacillaceae bacterium]